MRTKNIKRDRIKRIRPQDMQSMICSTLIQANTKVCRRFMLTN